MSSPSHALTHRAHRCSFNPDRQDPYLRLSTVTVFVRDQERSLRYYVDQLGFSLAHDLRLPSGDRLLAVTPPDGTAMLSLVTPKPGSEEYSLIGRPTQIVFMTEDLPAKFEEWRQRGVRFCQSPREEDWGATSASFEDADGNSFTLLEYEAMTREIEEQRRDHAERREHQRRAAAEQEYARKVQSKLFPQSQPPLETLDYGGVCVQAREVGGDYYDFLELDRGRVGLVIGDVSGKGTAAALLMANLQAHVRNLGASYSYRPFTPFALGQPQRFLITLNRLFCDSTTESAYATFFFAEYDDQRRRLRYANCGHLPALLLRRDGDLERLESTCAILGLFKAWECGVGERDLFPGDTLVFYTDGVTESFNDDDEQFGERRLIEALCKYRHSPSQTLLESLLDDVRRFSHREQHDDITLMVAKCR
ncbi:MAG: PP2C family protein-serine/threonine phosphatase [Terriglobia bacterium]